MNLATARFGLAALLCLGVSGCAGAVPTDGQEGQPAQAPSAAGSGSAHGAVAGAAEVGEPQLKLVSVDTHGHAGMLDLLREDETPLATLEAPEMVSTDGRYVFSVNGSGVDITDSGAWTWDHTDHFHYYTSEPRAVGRVAGGGAATLTTTLLSTAGSTGLFFPTTGEAVLLENAALSKGKISISKRIPGAPHKGLAAALGDEVILSQSDGGEGSVRLAALDAAGTETASVPCLDAEGTITTHAGLVVGCSDSAVLAAVENGQTVFQSIPYPAGAAPAATSFAARKSRTLVAGIGEGAGIWLLDTRAGNWAWLPTPSQPVAAATVDNAEGHVVAALEDGTVRVYQAQTGKQLAATEALLERTTADPETSAQVHLTVDAHRAYVNAPAEGLVFEVDFADAARVSRTLEPQTAPVHVVVTGR